MPLTLFEGALGGVGLFLLGMRIMSDGIRTVADARIRGVFSAITSNRLYSIVFGVMLALTLNSPTAAVIFSIGLVNGGVLNTFQALNVFAGVLIGASLILYLPVAPYGFVATPLIFFGVLLKFFAHRRRLAHSGDLILGAGLLFFGLNLLEGSFSFSASHPFYGAFHGAFFHKTFPAFLFGSLISCFVQSTTTLMRIIAALAPGYHMSVDTATAMALGGPVGVAIIGGVASVTGVTTSRRITLIYLLFNVAVIAPLVCVTPYLAQAQYVKQAFELFGSWDHNALLWSHLALTHSFASLTAAMLLTLSSGSLSRLSGAMDMRGIGRSISQPCAGYLDPRILNTPTLAIEQARKEVVRMISVVVFMFADTREILFNFDARRAETIRQHEHVLDSLNHEISAFLSALARSVRNPEINHEIPWLLQTVADLEHIGDSCEEILDCIMERKELQILFSNDAMTDLKRLAFAVGAGVGKLEELFEQEKQVVMNRLPELESATRQVCDEIQKAHYERICTGICVPRAAKMFNELITAFVRIAELCWNILATREKGRE